MDSSHVHTLPPLKSKLPIKRKTSSSTAAAADADADAASILPPLKSHRIWTEPDEIRFLQGLLHSASLGLVFPRDLHVFYDRYSGTISQPYTKSQLSEKLRRLRNKFRMISSCLARGLDLSMLSPHDRALYDLSKKLWCPDSSSISLFAGNPVVIKVEDDPIGDPSTNKNQNVDEARGVNGDRKLSKVDTKTVLEVFDQCVREARTSLVLHRTLSQAASIFGDAVDFGKRWEEQKALELDVFVRRLRLVLEKSLLHQN